MTVTRSRTSLTSLDARSAFLGWKKAHPEADVWYRTKERARHFIERGAEKGVLHRIGSRETSAALEDALRLERSEAG